MLTSQIDVSLNQSQAQDLTGKISTIDSFSNSVYVCVFVGTFTTYVSTYLLIYMSTSVSACARVPIKCIWQTDVSILRVCVCVHVGGWVHVLNTLVFNEMLECRCSLMLLVTQSAMQLRSLSAWSFLHTTVHPSTLTVGGSDGVENGGKMEKRNPNVGNSEMSWITSVLMNLCLLNSYKPYTVHVH